MASRKDSLVPSVQFFVNWKIKWPKFASITLFSRIGKVFDTSYNNIPLKWEAALHGNSDGVDFFLYYQDDPIERFNGMQWAISIMKSDLSTAMNRMCGLYEESVGVGRGYLNYFDKDPTFRAKCGLQESDPLVIRITLKIPISVFTYAPSASPSTDSPKWLIDLFSDIQDPTKSIFWSAKLISRDGAEFYCHKMIAYQCPAIQAMFRHPPPDGQPENEYKFPRLGSAALRILIQYLYTGQANKPINLAHQTTTTLIEVADAAEMYLLKPLKEACTVVLWKVIVERPESCSEILRFANLHDDLKHLKNRAMDVLAENYQTAYSFNMFGDGLQGDILRDQFYLFLSRRVEANSSG